MNGGRQSLRDEDGAVAVLYSILMLLMVGLVALVVDLGALKWDRRATQLTADVASTAGALNLLSVPGSPGSGEAACRIAWEYFLENTAMDGGGADPCAAWAGVSCTSPHSAVTANSGPYEVTITWPVPQGSPLLEGRFDEPVDGSPDGCDRIAVQIRRSRGFIFGAMWQLEGTTGALAVARSDIEEKQELAAALVVLDPYSCAAIEASGAGGGQGAIHVFQTVDADTGDPAPGIITVDSDGRGEHCSTQKVIRLDGEKTSIKAGLVDENGDGREDTADGSLVVRNGVIFNYALQTANAARSYLSSDVTSGRLAGGDTSPPLPGDPPVPGDRSTRIPWHHRYDCRNTYTDADPPPHMPLGKCEGFPEEGVAPNSAYITALRGGVASIAAEIAAASAPMRPVVAALHGYNYLSDCGVTGPLVPGSVGYAELNWWFDCDLTVGSGKTLEITGGNVVVQGGVRVRGTLGINRNGTEDNWVYVRDNLEKEGTGSLRLGNPSADPNPVDKGGTFVLLGTGANSSGGRIDMQGGAKDEKTGEQPEFTWVAPYRGKFEDLALWTEYNNIDNKPHNLGGDLSNLTADGIFYMPNAKFKFSGSGQMDQQRAQFISYRLLAAGRGALRVQPDPSRARTQYGRVVRLIR